MGLHDLRIPLHDQRPGNAVELVDRDGPETPDEGDDFHLPVERVGAVFEADGDVTEILIAPFLLNDGVSFRQSRFSGVYLPT